MPFRAHRKRVFRWMQICAPIIYTMLKTCTPYNEECFEQRRLRCERKRANRLVNELQKLGYVVVAPDWCLLPYCSASDRQGLPLFVLWIFHLWGVEKRFVKVHATTYFRSKVQLRGFIPSRGRTRERQKYKGPRNFSKIFSYNLHLLVLWNQQIQKKAQLPWLATGS